MDTMTKLYQVILDRKNNSEEGSYTCYLFDKGMDKILKKVAEESGEVIIAAKNGDNKLLNEEVCDLLYHVLVMCAEADLPIENIFEELDNRAQKIGNLKNIKITDHNT